ncbi:hypothetical protein EBBID32_36030 [Sphingobium indicum BiD32]|uniref:Uncharacterized protein n=1 Tax=Sphingobium indicum BiD32 TaxID=1301087 RepID=N1MUE7_9SPHN|nr:hypothetical protein EBBID32_36030 [Sphingobium indicum BiD32]
MKTEQATTNMEIGLFVYNCTSEYGGAFLNLSVADYRDYFAVNCATATRQRQEFGLVRAITLRPWPAAVP